MKKLSLIMALVLTAVFAGNVLFTRAIEGSRAENKEITDIGKHWAKEAIEKTVDKEHFVDEKGKFHPDKAITRSEFVMMLHKALGINIMYFKAPDITEIYGDVKNEDAYASALMDLVTARIIDIKGYFRPNETIRRDELVHYIINSLDYMTGGQYAMIMIMPPPFADDDEINPEYKQDIIKAQLLKLINGKGKNFFCPKDNATRAEAAALIYRLKEILKEFNETVQVNPSVETSEEGMKLKLMIVNNSDKNVTINHSSGQKFDFVLLDSDRKEIYRWSGDKGFITALTETVIEAGKSIEFSVDVEKEEFEKLKGKAAYMKAYITGVSEDFEIDPDGYEAEIIW